MMAVVRAPDRVQKMSQLREGSLRGRLGMPIMRRAGFWAEVGGLGAEAAEEDGMAEGEGFCGRTKSVRTLEAGCASRIRGHSQVDLLMLPLQREEWALPFWAVRRGTFRCAVENLFTITARTVAAGAVVMRGRARQCRASTSMRRGEKNAAPLGGDKRSADKEVPRYRGRSMVSVRSTE